MNYEEDMRIDESSLDSEWLEQAPLAMKYVRYYAECRKTLTEAEEKVKVVKAELIARANSDPLKFCGKEKTNVADIEAYYRKHKLHKEAKEEWITALYECNMAEGAKNEISFTRKATLENMVQLHAQQYFAGPKVPRTFTQIKEDRERIEEKMNNRISSKIGRRTK